MENRQQIIARWKPFIDQLRVEHHIPVTISNRIDEHALFCITNSRQPTIYVKNHDQWEDDQGRTGQGPQTVYSLILHDKAADVRRILQHGSDQSRMLTLLEATGQDATSIQTIHHQSNRTIINYRDRHGMNHTIEYTTDPNIVLTHYADQLDAYATI